MERLRGYVCGYVTTCRQAILWILSLFLLIVFLPMNLLGEDRLIIRGENDNSVFSVTDTGSIMFGSNIWDAPNYVKLYGVAEGTQLAIGLNSFSSSSTAGAGLTLGFSRGTQREKKSTKYGDRLGYILFTGYDGSKSLASVGFTAKVDGPISLGSVPAKLVFETNPSGYPRIERMVISSEGNVGIGVLKPTHLLHLSGGAYSDGHSWLTSSSREYKQNIRTLDVSQALNTLQNLHPVVFQYRDNSILYHVGFIAEEVSPLIAAADMKGIDAVAVASILTKVIQEQQKTILQLTNRIEKLEKSIRQEIND
ncbi:Chaperone of endosialidase [Syntrophus gentianae]|uniref:Chaperone of endosialidase n=1 Tax=Syntrophus gentianae TaxID=43775 RepID=A0A1H7ZIS3_9BACT|nr:tail fiber domain-containing protein [Syntrophus gentianae]SEM58173.1 Chaperone of endosialidase [Syntrophus gentianae]